MKNLIVILVMYICISLNYELVKSQDDENPIETYFIPSYGAMTSPDRYNVRISGLVYRHTGGSDRVPSDYSSLLDKLRQDGSLTQQQKDNLINRTEAFTWDLQDEQEVRVTFPDSGQNYTLVQKTGNDGHFEEFVTEVNIENVPVSEDAIGNRIINFTTPDGQYQGSAIVGLLSGQSIVIDFDDVLRITRIWNPEEMIRRSFVDEYEVVPGMPQLLKNWESKLHNPIFHYLTTSPIQMARVYSKWLDENYPLGPKDFRPVDFAQLSEVLNARTKALEQYVDVFPNRTFIVIGDVSTIDQLSVFPSFAEKFPNNIQCVLMRNTSAEEPTYNSILSNSAIALAFRNIPPSKWFLYDHASDLENIDIANGGCHPPGYGPNDVSATKGAVTPYNDAGKIIFSVWMIVMSLLIVLL